MLFQKTIRLKNGKPCLLRNVEVEDAGPFLDYFIKCHGETEYLTTYPDETTHTVEEEAAWILARKESKSDIEIIAVVDGVIAASAGIGMLKDRAKTRHRAVFGITVLKEYWRLGIGSALTEACIECAKKAGYRQIELEVVAENEAAVLLYRKYGFTVYGSNPRGFLTRSGKWQELLEMRLELGRPEETIQEPEPVRRFPMDLTGFDRKHVKVTDQFGGTYTGVASFENIDFMSSEFGINENCLRIDDDLIRESIITSVEEIEVHGSAELWAENVILRRFTPEDAETLYNQFGKDAPEHEFPGRNLYETPETAKETVNRFIEGYSNGQFYAWVIDWLEGAFGTIGAGVCPDGHIELTFHIVPHWAERRFAYEALQKALEYLTENEGFSRVIARCDPVRTEAMSMFEKAGMQPIRSHVAKDDHIDQVIFEYLKRS